MRLVSVIMAVGENQDISAAVTSILKQTYINFELIISINFKKADFQKIKNYYSTIDKRIVVVNSDKIRGAWYARNMAIQIAKGDYIAICDNDDIWLANHLELSMEKLKMNDVVFSNSYEILSNYSILNKRYIKYNRNINKFSLLLDHQLCHSSMVSKKFQFLKYDSFKTRNDFSLWLKFFYFKKNIAFNTEFTVIRTYSNKRLSSNYIKNYLNIFYIWKKYNKLNYKFFQYYFLGFIQRLIRLILFKFKFLNFKYSNILNLYVSKKFSQNEIEFFVNLNSFKLYK